MCDFSGKLIAWLDRELPAEEAAEVERHLAGCSECRSGVDAYKRVSGEFDAYCDAAMASNARRGTPRWVPVASAAGAVAALVALFLAIATNTRRTARVPCSTSSGSGFSGHCCCSGSRFREADDPESSSAAGHRARPNSECKRRRPRKIRMPTCCRMSP